MMKQAQRAGQLDEEAQPAGLRLIDAIFLQQDEKQSHADDRPRDRQGKPGMLLAQVYPDHMLVGLVSHERARQLSDGTVAKSADERHEMAPPKKAH